MKAAVEAGRPMRLWRRGNRQFDVKMLDVSRYKYPPVWVEASAIFAAMNTIDSDTAGKTRGYLIVERRARLRRCHPCARRRVRGAPFRGRS